MFILNYEFVSTQKITVKQLEKERFYSSALHSNFPLLLRDAPKYDFKYLVPNPSSATTLVQ